MSAVCAADLNQTTDDVKTDDKEDSIIMLTDDDVNTSDEKCIPLTAEDEDNQVTDAGEVVSENDTVTPTEIFNSPSVLDIKNNDTIFGSENITPCDPDPLIYGMPLIIPEPITIPLDKIPLFGVTYKFVSKLSHS